ncbi:MAG: transporter [Acidobacteriota bacterium]
MARSASESVLRILASVALVTGLASPAAAQGTTVSAGVNIRALTGSFGSTQTTTLFYAPATLQINTGRLELIGYFPWLSLDNATVVPSQGGFIPMRGTMAGAPGTGLPMGGAMGGMMGGPQGIVSPPGAPPALPDVSTRLSGIGDLVVGAGYRVVDDSARGLQVVASTRIKIPTASAETGLGTGRRDIAFLGTIRKQSANGWISAEGGYIVVGDPTGIDLRNSVLWSVGAGRRLQRRLYLLMSAAGSTAIVPEFGAPVEVGAGIGIALGGRLNLTVVPSVGLTDASPRAALTIGFSTDLTRR